MTNAKKPTAAKPVAEAVKTTEKAAEKATEKTASAVKSNVSALESRAVTPDQMVHAGTEAVKDFIAAGTQEAQKTQEKVLSISKENIEKWSETTDRTVRSFVEIFAANQDQVEALLESSKIATDLGRDLQEQLVSEINALFSENVELSKELLACRTLNDLVQVQNRALQSNVSHFFNQSARLSEAWFKLAIDAVEPINTQAAQVTARLNKSLAA